MWLRERGYSDKLVRKQVLRGRAFNRNFLLNKETNMSKSNIITLNITYHPAFARIRDILSKIHLLLTPNDEHRKVFPDIPLVGFKRAKSLKDMLVRAKLPKVNQEQGYCKKCQKKRCEVCKVLVETNSFSDRNGQNAFVIKSGELNCDSQFVVYLVQCRTCDIQYVGSASTKFRLRLNNYKACSRKFLSGNAVPQESFHAHFHAEGHNGINDWQFTLIDKATDTTSLRRKESFWQYKLKTFSPQGLNEREVTLDYG